jgi:Spy/CpxP family protein refolding chaperone
MRMKRAAAAAAFAMLGFSLLASAQEPPGGGERARRARPEHRGARLAEYLGLDAQQKAALQQLQQQHRDEMKPLWDEGRELRSKLRAATEAEKPDAQAVGEATLALKAHRERMKADRAAFEQKLEGLLTPDQKQKFEALKAARELDRGSRGRARHARHAAPGGGL